MSMPEAMIQLFDAKMTSLMKKKAFFMANQVLFWAWPTILSDSPEATRKNRAIAAGLLCDPSAGEAPKLDRRWSHDFLNSDVTTAQQVSLRAKAVTSLKSMGGTGLHICAMMGDVEVAEMLVTSGVIREDEVGTFNKLGAQALHSAATMGQIDMVKYLLRLRADVNSGKAPTSVFAGQTALHGAAQRGHVSCCQALLEHGAVANAT